MTALRALILSMLVLCSVQANAQPLITAARNGDTSALEALLEDGADPNVEGAVGTALHIASLKGDASAAALLLNAGAEVNAWNDRLGTPLLASLSAGGIYGKPSLDRSEIVALLIDAGADLDVETEKGMTARFTSQSSLAMRLLSKPCFWQART